MNYDKAAGLVAASEYKMTKAREGLLRVLVRMKGPFTAHELLEKCTEAAKRGSERGPGRGARGGAVTSKGRARGLKSDSRRSVGELSPWVASARVDLATIYRNLPVFEELGLICKSDFSDEVSRYMVTHPGHDHHHHHIICRSCAKVEAVDFCVLQGQEQILAKLGFRAIRHRLEFSGLCAACA